MNKYVSEGKFDQDFETVLNELTRLRDYAYNSGVSEEFGDYAQFSDTAIDCIRRNVNADNIENVEPDDQVLDIRSIEDALIFVEDHAHALWQLRVALTVKDVEYQLKEISECPVWNSATQQQAVAIAESVCEVQNDNDDIYSVAVDVIGVETVDS